MKWLYFGLLSLFFFSIQTSAQELPVPEAIKTVPNAKCYWSYNVERLSSKPSSSLSYIIHVGITQVDSSGLPAGSLRLQNAVIYCKFTDKLISKKVYCKAKGYGWFAKFNIHTFKPLIVEIIASYRGQQQTMKLTLNEGTYPGEGESAKEKLPEKINP